MKRTQPVMLIVFAAIAFMNVARNPRFEMFHAVDVLSLLACGMCIGVAIALTLRLFRVGQLR
jgi:predicted metal-binding protein